MGRRVRVTVKLTAVFNTTRPSWISGRVGGCKSEYAAYGYASEQ